MMSRVKFGRDGVSVSYGQIATPSIVGAIARLGVGLMVEERKHENSYHVTHIIIQVLRNDLPRFSVAPSSTMHSVELEHRFCIRHEYPFNARACSSYTFLQYPSQPLAVHYALSLLISQAHIVQSSCFEHGSSFHASFVPTW